MNYLYIALLSFFSLMIIFSIILAIALGDFKRYSCIDNECVVRKNGKYRSKSNCKKECNKIIPPTPVPPTPTKLTNYICDSSYQCKPSTDNTGVPLSDCEKSCVKPTPLPLSEDKNLLYVWSKLPEQRYNRFRLATIKFINNTRYKYNLIDYETDISLGTLEVNPDTKEYSFTDQTGIKYDKFNFNPVDKWFTTDTTPVRVVLSWVRYPAQPIQNCNVVSLSEIVDNTLENIQDLYYTNKTNPNKDCPTLPVKPGFPSPISQNYFYVWNFPLNKPAKLANIQILPGYDNGYMYKLSDSDQNFLGLLNVIYNPSKKEFTYSFENKDGKIYSNYDPKYRWISGTSPGDNEERVFLSFPIYPIGGNCRNFPAPTGVNTVKNFRAIYDLYNTDGTTTYSFDPMSCVIFDKSDYKIIVDDNIPKGQNIKMITITFGDIDRNTIGSYSTYRNIFSKDGQKIAYLSYYLSPYKNSDDDIEQINVLFGINSTLPELRNADTYLKKCQDPKTCILKDDSNIVSITNKELNKVGYIKEPYAYIPKTKLARKNAI